MNDEFYTLEGYHRKNQPEISEAMEDYLEMIFRLAKDGDLHTKELAENLHVRPSSVTKMVQRLREKGLVFYERYSKIKLTSNGLLLASYLIERHRILMRFFTLLHPDSSPLEEVEQVEHYFKPESIYRLSRLLPLLQNDSESDPADETHDKTSI